MLLTYFLNNFEMVPVAPIIFVVTIHTRRIYIVSFLQCRIFSASLSHFYSLTLQHLSNYTLVLLSLIMISSLLIRIVRQFAPDVPTIGLPHLHVLFPTNFGTYSYQCSFAQFYHLPPLPNFLANVTTQFMAVCLSADSFRTVLLSVQETLI